MPSAAVEAAFRARLAANWDTADGVIYSANGVTRPPADGSPFLIIQYLVSGTRRPVMSTRRFEEGSARIVYNAATGDGLSVPLAKSDAIAAAFRGDRLRIGASSNVEVFEPSPPTIDDPNPDGNYCSFIVTVPYRYQFDVVDTGGGGGDAPNHALVLNGKYLKLSGDFLKLGA